MSIYDIEQLDEELRGSTANITYTLGFQHAAQHLVHVRMRVSAVTTPTITCVMPSWSPGSYKIRDYVGYQGNVEVFTVNGSVRKTAKAQWINKASIEVDCEGASVVELEYVVYGFDRSVRTNHINRNHAFVVPAGTLMYVEGRMQEVHHVILEHDQGAWPRVSTQLSAVATPAPGTRAASTPLVLGAKNYDVLADSPLEVGDHEVRSFDAHGATHELALVGAQPSQADWLVDQIKRIVETEAKIFGGVPYDRYVFIVQVYPGGAGGLEHSRSSVNAVEPAVFLEKGKVSKLLSLLTHEYFHVWNVKRIRPIELGPFDYTSEVYTPMLWLAEGLTSYYDDLLHYRCGFATATEYVDTLAKEHVSKLLRVQGRFRMSVRDSSRLAWVKLYMGSPDGQNRFPSYYLKGGVVMWMLDLYVIAHSDGKASLDDALRGLWKRYMQTPSVGLAEDEAIAIMERSTGVQLRDRLMDWLDGTEELPIAEMLAPFGYTLEIKTRSAEEITFGENRLFAHVPPEVFVGWTLADRNGDVVVRGVEDRSPAFEAGIGIDDELVSVNGQRIQSVAALNQLLAMDGAHEVTLEAQTDGVMYTTKLVPQPDTFVTIQSVAAPSDTQQHLRSVWLQRNL